MSNFENLELFNKVSTARAARSFEPATTVFIDVAADSTRAEVTRGGFNLGEIFVRPDVIGDVLDTRPIVQTKVVSQTIAPGTAVARGTAIDLVLTRTDDLPLTIIPGVHQFFQNLTMADAFGRFEQDPTVRDIVRRRTDVAQLTSNEQTALTTALAQQGVQVGTDADNDLGSAFTALQAAFTFQG